MAEPNDNNDPVSPPIIPDGVLPTYLADAFGDLYEEDGLAVLGRGLGALSLLASLVRFYADPDEGHAKLAHLDHRPLVIVLGVKEDEFRAMIALLESWGTPRHLLPTLITNEAGQNTDRAALYQQGGVFCITSRILIVDLLTKTAKAEQIDGMLIAHAEHVTEQSTEAFILRIYQSQKLGRGFVKAVSEAPEQLMAGFAKIDKILKALYVRRLYLYPRFQHAIREELERHPPSVDEWHQQLSPLQQEMQAALLAAVQSVIRELKSSTPLLEWNDTELSLENCVSSGFDRAISRQLEQDWHRLRPQTKQLVQDLRTLRTLFQAILQYDCVSFWNLLKNLKTTSAKTRHPSLWLLTPAADVLFRKAKERVYRIQRASAVGKVGKLIPVLEESPKWKLLKTVLHEIEEDYQKNKPSTADWSEPTTVLVLADDERTVEALRSHLADGSSSRTLLLRWLRYLEGLNDRSRAKADSRGVGDMPEEDRLLLEEEGRARRILFGTSSVGKKNSKAKRQLNQVPDYLKKRRRIAAERSRGKNWQQADDLERQAVLEDAVGAAEHELEASQDAARQLEKDAHEMEEEAMFKATYEDELRVVLKSYSSMDGGDASLLLQDLRPKYVILYDAEVSFIRAVEVNSALCCATDPVRVFFLMFEASAEEKNFMKALDREKDAFERLIHHKKTMPLPALHSHATQEMQQAAEQGMVSASYMGGSLPLAFDSRKGVGKTDRSKERRDIAVDVREFRSALPSILHQGGMRLAPVTLTVGDFVLSNVHCVERKSISDLFGSFASGRLYTQAEAMSKYYKCPCLLIEFDPSKSFCLQNVSEIGSEIRSDSVCSKMSLLVMHFPKLRILWSRSPHETLRIFRELKTNHDEVDVDKAVEIGRSESVDGLLEGKATDEDKDEINEAARDMLLRLPGVSVQIARRIMQEVDTLAELAQLSREELRRIAGPATGQKLFTFFRQKVDS